MLRNTVKVLRYQNVRTAFGNIVVVLVIGCDYRVWNNGSIGGCAMTAQQPQKWIIDVAGIEYLEQLVARLNFGEAVTLAKVVRDCLSRPQPHASTKGVAQERQTKSPDARNQLCRSEPSKHTCIYCGEVQREKPACENFMYFSIGCAAGSCFATVIYMLCVGGYI